MTRAAILLVGLLFPFAVASEPAHELVVHGFSKHVTDIDSRTGRAWNERNFGLGYRRVYSDDLSVQVGAYRNSQYRVSTYAMADWTPLAVAGARLGASIGAVTGYDIGSVIPAASAVARVTVDRLSMTVRYLPPWVPKFTSVVALEFSWRF